MRGSLDTTRTTRLATGLCSWLLVACTAVPAPAATSPGTTGGPVVVIAAPAANSTLPLGAPAVVRVVAADPVGVARLELAADGVSVASHGAPGRPEAALTAEFAWTPASEGAHLLSVTAYRADGTPGVPAVVAVSVLPAGARVSPGASGRPAASALPPVLRPGGAASRAPATGGPPVVTSSTVGVPVSVPPVATVSPPPAGPVVGVETQGPGVFVLPNLRVSGGIGHATGNGEVHVNYQIINAGAADAGGFKVRLTCRGVVQTHGFGPLPAGRLQTLVSVNGGFSAGFSLAEGAPTSAGGTIEIDPYGEVTETTEYDNRGNLAIPDC